MPEDHDRVIAVVVAYNRADLLRECLTALCAQTRPPDGIVVIDNASTDASAEVARSVVPDVHLVNLPVNLGGAGGFTAGIAEALGWGSADMVWLLDDDTVPTEGALDALLKAKRHVPRGTVLLASTVIWSDGRPHPMNMPRVRPGTSHARRTAARAHGCYPVRSASFVSVLIEADAVRQQGLPISAYFLWNDDFEYTARLLRESKGYVVAGSVVVHKTKTFGSTNADPGPRFALEVRNKIWLMRESRALAVHEKVLFGGATLLRWLRTWSAAHDRRTIARGFRDGLRQGIQSGPADNETVFADVPQIAASIAVIERSPTRLRVERDD